MISDLPSQGNGEGEVFSIPFDLHIYVFQGVHVFRTAHRIRGVRTAGDSNDEQDYGSPDLRSIHCRAANDGGTGAQPRELER